MVLSLVEIDRNVMIRVRLSLAFISEIRFSVVAHKIVSILSMVNKTICGKDFNFCSDGRNSPSNRQFN